MSLSSWVVLGLVPGLRRRPEKKLGADEEGLLSLLHRWRDEAERPGCSIRRICVALEAGRDGFWLARWLDRHGIERHVIHASSIPVQREQRRAKTDRLDCRLLMRGFVGWLRGEAENCRMVAVPSIEAEDAKIPHRDRSARSRDCTRVINRMKATLARLGIRGFKPEMKKATDRLDDLRLPTGEALPPNALAELRLDMALLRVLVDQIQEIKDIRETNLEEAPDEAQHSMVRMLAEIRGLGKEAADMLVSEALSRDLRDRRAVARYGGLTGSPDESGSKRIYFRDTGWLLRVTFAGRVGNWRAEIRVRWQLRRFRDGPRSGSHNHVSSPRSPNPACRFPALGSPVGSCVSYTGDRRCSDDDMAVIGFTDDLSGRCTAPPVATLHSRPTIKPVYASMTPLHGV